MSSYNRYSHHARRALTHAALLATRYRHAGVDTGHLLVGVMHTEGSIGCQVLEDLNLTPMIAEPYLKTLCPVVIPAPDPVLNLPSLDEVLALSADESNWLGHHYIGTEHLLLGITRTNVGNASDLLHLLNVSPEQVRRRVRRALNDGLTESTLQLVRRHARLSELSRRVINAAEQIAVEFDHRHVTLGHLLLVLLMEKRSFTSTLLWESGLDEARLHWGLDRGDNLLMVGIDSVLDQALDYAERLGDHYTGTDHLLLTLTIDPAGIAILEYYGLSPEKLRLRLEEKLRGKR